MALSIGELVGYVSLDTEQLRDDVGGVEDMLGGATKSWGGLLKGAGLAGGALFASSMVGAMNVEAGTDRVSAALGLTEQEAARVGQVAGDLYAGAWGESMDEVNAAVEAVYSSIDGMNTATASELQNTTATALDFAKAMEVDVARAAQVAGQMVATGLADNATEAFDLLTAASSKVPKALREDLLDATDEYGQFFAQIGMSGEQAMSMLAAGAEKGMYGIDKAGDAVKEFTIRATDMSTSTKDAYKSIGLSAGKMTRQLLKGGDTAGKATQKIIDGLLAIKDPAKQSQAAIALFGTPLEDLSTKDIPVFLESLTQGRNELGKWEGASKRMGQSLNDNAITNLQAFGRTLKTEAIDLIGGKLIPVVNDFASALATNVGPALSSTINFLKEHKTALKVAAIAVGALLAVTKAHAIVMTVQSAGGMVAFLKGTKLITGATKTWTAVQWAMNAALSANPIGIVIVVLAALVAAVVLAYKKSETFREICTAAFDAVAAAGRWLWNHALQPAFKGIVNGIAWVLDMWAKMLRGLSKVPGFGWAADAADKMEGAANKARGLADSIKKIPENKSVTVTYNEVVIRSTRDKVGHQLDRFGGARATGGPVQSGLSYLVGENGPEIFTAPTSGSIIPNHRVRSQQSEDAPATDPAVLDELRGLRAEVKRWRRDAATSKRQGE